MLPGTSTALDTTWSFVQGDTWNETPSLTITEDSLPPVNPVASVELQFRQNVWSPNPSLTLSNTDGTIVITSAANWIFQFPEQDLPLKAGTYVYSLRTTDNTGKVQTYLTGQIVVQPSIVKP